MIRKYIAIFICTLFLIGYVSNVSGYTTPYSPENHFNQWNSNFNTYIDGDTVGFNASSNKSFGYPFALVPNISETAEYSDDLFNFTIGEADWISGYDYKFVNYTNIAKNMAYLKQNTDGDHINAIQSFVNQSENTLYSSVYYFANFSEIGFLSCYMQFGNQLLSNEEGDDIGFSGKKFVGTFGFTDVSNTTDNAYLFFVMHDGSFFYVYDQKLGDIPIAVINHSLWYKFSFIWDTDSTVMHIYEISGGIESVINEYDIGYSIPIKMEDFKYFYTICSSSNITDKFFSIDGFVREPYAWDVLAINNWVLQEFIGINATFANIALDIPFEDLNFGYFPISETDISTMNVSRIFAFFRNPFDNLYGISMEFLVISQNYGIYSKGIYLSINYGFFSKISDNYLLDIIIYCDENNTMRLNGDDITPIVCDGFPEFIGNQSDITLAMEIHGKSVSGFKVSMTTDGIMYYPIFSLSYNDYINLYYSYIMVNSCMYIGSGSGLFLEGDLIQPIYNENNSIFIRAESVSEIENKSYDFRIYATDGSLFLNLLLNVTFNYKWENRIAEEEWFNKWILENWSILLIISLSIIIGIFISVRFRIEKIKPTSSIFGNNSETFITYGGKIPNRCNITKNGIQCDLPKSLSERFKN